MVHNPVDVGRYPQRVDWKRGWVDVGEPPAPYDARRLLSWVGLDWKYQAGVRTSSAQAWPYHRISVGLPYWLLVTVVSGLSWLVGRPARMRRRRGQLGRCIRCGYDTRATPRRCPECGYEPPGDGAALVSASA